MPADVASPATAQAAASRSWAGLSITLIARAIASPRLARDLLLVAWRFRDRRWLRRFPFLPVPSRPYVRWRMYTAYGDANAIPPVEDIVRYARWAGRR
ncbi:MAG: hypothetical protein IT361_04580 [Gemmatimonadaceae bacterium]|nr:hypothetical protein [Gemmatimonadaceae bacterium]